MSKYEEIKAKYSPIDSAVRADIALLLKALEYVTKEHLCMRGIDYPYQTGMDKQNKMDYWLEQAQKEIKMERIRGGPTT